MTSLTQDDIDRNAHISTDEILSDIRETEDEIVDMLRDIRFKQEGIMERRKFIAKLQELLTHRNQPTASR